MKTLRMFIEKTINSVFLFFVCGTVILYSCTSNESILETKYYKNGSIDYQKTLVSEGTIAYKSYFMSGKLYEMYFLKNDSIKHGKYVSYFSNGKLSIEGNYKNGFEDGLFKFYNNNGTPDFIVEYLKRANIDSSDINQRIYFNEKGDTIKDSLSYYYTTYFINDTIEIGENYKFKIELVGARYSNAFIHLGKYDSCFSNIPINNNDTFSFENDMIIEVHKTNNVQGLNIIRALIINYEKDIDGKIIKLDEMAFIDSFYVN